MKLSNPLLLLLYCLFISFEGFALCVKTLPEVYGTESSNSFPLVADGRCAPIYIDGDDFSVVRIASNMFADDIKLVSGAETIVKYCTNLNAILGEHALVAGTLGKSRLIDALAREGLFPVDSLRNKRESFIIATLDNPETKGTLLVVAGSDRRGTAFGLTSLSEIIGVSPWYWWADVIPDHKPAIYIKSGCFLQGEPSVAYRGIFINDERFGGWAKWVENTFDKETGKVGPKVYEKVFELLLRLKGNYLWPAMHPGTQAFNADPENARLADEYAIVMGSSHCEQMLRNNEDEWKAKGIYGDFNYITNRRTMQDYWEERVKTNGKYENTYTLGLRGIHDYPMEGASTTDERVAIMQQAIHDQREILARNIDSPIEEIPQVLCTYEEVLDAYHNGLKVPDDVTLLWSDDKHGFTRNLCNPEEMKRKGGAGIYYHLSYHGDPASWIWLSPLSPAFISTELTKAYEFGARKIWVFNVGDIKPAEKEISFAMDLAWDIDRWRPENAHNYIRHWAEKTFGAEFADEIADIQKVYYRLQASGKDAHVFFVNFPESELQRRIDDYRVLAERAEILAGKLPDRLKDAYFELVLYPVKGASMLNEYQLLARRSLARATYNEADLAMADASRARQMYDSLNAWTYIYNNNVAGGKWGNFFDWKPYHWHYATSMAAPVCTEELLAKVTASDFPRFLNKDKAISQSGVEIMSDKDCEMPLWINALTPIRNFSKAPADNEFCAVEIGDSTFIASATPINNVWHAPYVGPMWSKVGSIHLNKGVNNLKLTDIKNDARIDSLFIGIYPPFPAESRLIIPAYEYSDKRDGCYTGTIARIQQLGFSDGMIVLPFDTPSHDVSEFKNAPMLEYDVILQPGQNEIEIRTLPTLHIYEGRDARYAVQFEDDAPQELSIHADDFSAEWRWNVLRGYASRKIRVTSPSGGSHRIRLYFLDPGIVIQEIHIN